MAKKFKSGDVLFIGVGSAVGFGSWYGVQTFLPSITNIIVPFVPDFGIGLNRVGVIGSLVFGLFGAIYGYMANHDFLLGAGLGSLGYSAYAMSTASTNQARLRMQRMQRPVMRPTFRPVVRTATPTCGMMRNFGNGKTVTGRSSGTYKNSGEIRPAKLSVGVISS